MVFCSFSSVFPFLKTTVGVKYFICNFARIHASTWIISHEACFLLTRQFQHADPKTLAKYCEHHLCCVAIFFFFTDFTKYFAFHSHFAHSLAGNLLFKGTTCWNLLSTVLSRRLLIWLSLAEHERSPLCNTWSPSQLTQIKSHRSQRQLVLLISTDFTVLFFFPTAYDRSLCSYQDLAPTETCQG